MQGDGTSLSEASVGAWVFACIFGTLLTTLVIGFASRWYAGDWARAQILEAPSRRLRPLKWTVSGVLVAALAFAFDKVDVSEVLDGRAQRDDAWWSVVTTFLFVFYGFALNFLWRCEHEVETNIDSLRVDIAVANAKIEALKQALSNERRLANYLNHITGGRWTRMRRLLKENKKEITAEEIVKVVDPAGQFAEIMVSLWRLVYSHYRGGLDTEQQLRVAYYEPIDGYLRCVASYDGVRADCIHNPNRELADAFRLTDQKAKDCLAVYCALRAPREPFVVEDAVAADVDPSVPFRFLSASQQEHIKSIVGFCCRRADTDEPPHPVVTIDSSQPAFFRDTDESRQELDRMLNELSLRAAFESDVDRLMGVLLSSGLGKEGPK